MAAFTPSSARFMPELRLADCIFHPFALQGFISNPLPRNAFPAFPAPCVGRAVVRHAYPPGIGGGGIKNALGYTP